MALALARSQRISSEPRYATDARGWLFAADVLTLVGCLLLTMAIHRPLGIGAGLAGAELAAHVALLTCFSTGAVLRLAIVGQYERRRRLSSVDDLVAVARALLLAAAIAVFVGFATDGYLLDVERYSRGLLALGIGLPIAALAALRLVAHRAQAAAFAMGGYLSRSLVIGTGERARRFTARLGADRSAGCLGAQSGVPLDLPVGRYMRRFTRELDDFSPDEVVLALEHPPADLLPAIAREVAYRNVQVHVLADVFEEYIDLPVSRCEGVPVSTIFQSPGDRLARQVKRIADRVGAAVGIVVLFPFLAAVAMLVWLEDRGPVFYSQERVGERGKRFIVYKFRTMQVDAEARMAALRVHNEADGPIFKMRDDPRVTRVGRVLRRFSIDEFPQLINVVLGQMSLVGPRPPIPSEVDEYRLEHRRRLMVPPGMTGLWQVSGRSDTTFDQMVDLDLRYIREWSLWLDVRILVRTAWVVLFARGAY